MLGAYIRVSSEMQRDNDSVVNQTARAKSVADKIGSSIVFYYDVMSGGKATRKEWVKLKEDISTNKIKIVWANENDRLGRDVTEAHAFLDLLIMKGCRLFIGTEEVDPNDDNDWLKYGFDSLISEADRRKIRKKTKETKAIVINDGRNTFRQLYGYDCKIVGARRNRPVREWYPVEHEVETIRKIYRLYLHEKMPLLKIALSLNEEGNRTKNNRYWTTRTLYHILHHIEYTGNTKDKSGTVIPSKVYTLNIVSLEDYYRVQEIYPSQSTNKSFRIGRPASHPASGLLKCAFCGSGYFYHAQAKYHSYYHNNPHECGKQQNRVISYIATNFIFDQIFIFAMSKNPKEIFDSLNKEFQNTHQQTGTEILHLEVQLGEIQKKLSRLMDLYEKTGDDSVINRFNELKVEKKALDVALMNSRLSLIQDEERIENVIATYSHLKQAEYVSASAIEKRRMLKSIITEAIIGNGVIQATLIDGRVLAFNYNDAKRNARKNRGVLRKATEHIEKIQDTSEIRLLLWLYENIDILQIETQLRSTTEDEGFTPTSLSELRSAIGAKIGGIPISKEMEDKIWEIYEELRKYVVQESS